ncbi:MAG: hypothetical protein EBY83_07695, partial [Verrucomicrobia bacterium]|nr:hypothetical protein [Verrucomicrobiota bacterium]
MFHTVNQSTVKSIHDDDMSIFVDHPPPPKKSPQLPNQFKITKDITGVDMCKLLVSERDANNKDVHNAATASARNSVLMMFVLQMLKITTTIATIIRDCEDAGKKFEQLNLKFCVVVGNLEIENTSSISSTVETHKAKLITESHISESSISRLKTAIDTFSTSMVVPDVLGLILTYAPVRVLMESLMNGALDVSTARDYESVVDTTRALVVFLEPSTRIQFVPKTPLIHQYASIPTHTFDIQNAMHLLDMLGSIGSGGSNAKTSCKDSFMVDCFKERFSYLGINAIPDINSRIARLLQLVRGNSVSGVDAVHTDDVLTITKSEKSDGPERAHKTEKLYNRHHNE